MKKGFLAVLVSVVAATWLVGCGGNVISGSGGDGGSGSGGGAGGGTTTTSTTQGTTSGTDTSSLCEQLCNVGLSLGCFEGGTAACVQSCEDTYVQAPECKAQLDAAYTCVKDKAPSQGCDIQAICPAEMMALQACEGNCGAGTCSGDGTSCSCDTMCNGVTRQVDCQSSAAGIDCTCFEGNAQVGTCTGSDLSCDIDGGCCAQYWAP